MKVTQSDQDPYDKRDLSTITRWKILIVGLMLLLIIPTIPKSVEGLGRLLPHPADSGIEITCSNPVMKSAPRFLSAPKGSAKYPFTSYCTSPSVPGAMTLRWEGSWTPSETRPDRPNASESITVTSYDGFIPGREPGGKIFMYWTGRCDHDPWLQPSTCDRFGGYVPVDVREALNQIDHERFPLTWKAISPSLKQHLVKQYQAVNPPISPQSSNQNLAIQPQQSQVITQAQRDRAMAVQPQMALPKPNTAASSFSRSGIFQRGVENQEGLPSGHLEKDTTSESVETSNLAILEEGTHEMAEPVALTLDRPLHVITAKGDAVKLIPGTYEIGTSMDLQLGLAKEGQPTILIPANAGTHNESIPRSMALVIPGQSNDEQHIVLLTPHGKRFDAQGSTSGIQSRGTGMVATLPDKILKDAIIQASEQPASEPPPRCHANSEPSGPRWLPVPCSMPETEDSSRTP